VQWIEASTHRRGSAYFAAYRYLLGDYAPYIYKTDDYGRTWTKLTTGTNGIPADWPTRAIREDPSREGLLYAGTEFGMFISFSDGANWQRFQLNLPSTPITDIKVHNKDLVISTQGRAFWILDNLSSLHQMGREQRAGEVHLYKPRDGYRTRTGGAMLNPTIEYYLPRVPTAQVSIEILDAGGSLVGRYASVSASAGPPGGGRGAAGGGRGAGAGAAGGRGGQGGRGGRGGSPTVSAQTNVVTTNVGLNRFVWGVQQDSTNLPLPPGSYRARLSVAGSTFTTEFNVLIDPRLAEEGVTKEDLAALFRHNTLMNKLNEDAQRTVQRITAAETRLRGATGAAADTLARVGAVAAIMRTVNVRYGKPGLSAHISYLRGMTSNVDQHPGKDALDRYALLRKELDDAISQLDRAIGRGGGPQPR
jgi:hypothetical protein